MNTTILKKLPFLAAAALLATSLAAAPPATVDIITEVTSGNLGLPGSNVTLRVRIANNTSTHTPRSVAMRVKYPTESVTWNSVASGQIGAVAATLTENHDGADPANIFYRDVATAGANVAAPPATPICFTINFTVTATPVYPFTIEVEPDPTSTAPVFYFQVTPKQKGTIAIQTIQNQTASTAVSDWSLYR
ncbi:hypothetical protein BH09SUM1_BH09SUM1_15100 [soil metagenome]